MGGSSTIQTRTMPTGGQSAFGMGQPFYGAPPVSSGGKGFQAQPPVRPGTQANYAPMAFMQPQFARPQFYYPTVQGQMQGQAPVAAPQPQYRLPPGAYPQQPVPQVGGGKGFQGMPPQTPQVGIGKGFQPQPQPFPGGYRPMPIAPGGGGPQPFMPGGGQDQFALPGPSRGFVPEPMLRGETEPRYTIQPVREDASFGNEKFGGMQQMQTLPAQLPDTMRAAVMPREELEPRETIQPVFDQTELP